MDQLLAMLPKALIAFLAVVLGFIALRLYDPPRTTCDLQMDLFHEAQKSFLYTESELGQPSLAKQAYEICKADNSPGGCFEFFERLKKLNIDLRNIPEQCGPVAAKDEKIIPWLRRSLELMVLMAWGEHGPVSYAQKNGWFDGAEVALFCDLKRTTVMLFGEDTYAEWREAILNSSPDSQKMGRDQAWAKSLLSTPCDNYR